MNISELVAVVLGLASVYLVIRQNVMCFPLGIISVALYVFIFYNVQLYADMGLQVAFIILQFYGWCQWLYGGKQKTALKVSSSSWKINIVLSVIVLFTTFSLGWILHKKTDAALPYWDSFQTSLSLAGQWMSARKYIGNWFVWILHKKTDAALPYWDSFQTSLSLAGQWMSARKYIGNWFVWILVNCISVWMYYVKDLHFTMLLYIVYLLLAVIGWIEWTRQTKIVHTVQ